MPQVHKPYAIFAALALSALSASPAITAAAQAQTAFTAYDETSTAMVDTGPYQEIISALSVPERGRTLVAYDVARAQALPFFQQYVNYLSDVESGCITPVEMIFRKET